MSHLFESGRIVDLILALVVLEVIGIGAYYRATGRGVPPSICSPICSPAYSWCWRCVRR